MTRRLDDLPRFPLREHGTPERVERIWRRLAPELGATSAWSRPQSWLAPATFVVVFGAGVFVGARWLHPESTPVLSAERPLAVEPVTGQQAPPTQPAGTAKLHPPTAPTHRRSTSLASPVLPLPSVSKQAPPVASVAPASSVPEWERLAEAGDFEAARTALQAQGGFEAVLGTATAAELMTLVDIGRASGSREHAIAALRRIVEVYSDAPEAPLAAWTLGNLLDQAGDELGAASAYALYRRLSPGGDFAEDALAREVESALSQGNLEQSARLIAQYENEFPNGRSLEEFRSELARRVARATGAPGVDTGAEADSTAEPTHGEAAPSKSPRADEAPATSVKPTQK